MEARRVCGLELEVKALRALGRETEGAKRAV